MKTTMKTYIAGALLGLSVPVLAIPTAAAAQDCSKLGITLKVAAANDGADVLELVREAIAENPNCACEITKAAIQGAKADKTLVAAIVEAAITAAPDQMEAVSQCAIAVAPDASSDVLAVLAKYDSLGADFGNPLDFPGEGEIPNPGDPGSLVMLPFWSSLIQAPVLNPPDLQAVPSTPGGFTPPPASTFGPQ